MDIDDLRLRNLQNNQNFRNNLSEEQKQEKRVASNAKNRARYVSSDPYREEKLRRSKEQKRQTARKSEFEIGQFCSPDNPPGELPYVGDFRQSEREGLWCADCGALYLREELDSQGKYMNCCMGGKLKNHLLIDEYVSPELVPLFCPKTKKEMKLSKIFKNNLIRMNNLFAMTSFAAKRDIWWSTVKVHGKILHKLDHVLPKEDRKAMFAQVYFLNENLQLEQRMEQLKAQITSSWQNCDDEEKRKRLEAKLRRFQKQEDIYRELMSMIQKVLNRDNAFVERYKSARELLENNNDIANVKIVFKCNERPQGTHARVYNAPWKDTIGVLVPDTDTTKYKTRCVVM